MLKVHCVLHLFAMLALSAPASAQVVTTAAPLVDTDGDGRIVVGMAITTPRVPRGTVLRTCAAERTYAVDGTACPPPAVEQRPTPATGPLFGVNLSGAEASGGDVLRPTIEDWKLYIERLGFRLIRYPFRMERMTPVRIADLKVAVEYARSKGVPVILDHHNFAWPPVEKQVSDWTAFAAHFPPDGSVILELNNEPKVTYARFGIEAKQVIAGLRATGVHHPILLGGPGYSAVTRFDKGEKASKACESTGCALDRAPGLLDPIGKTYIVGHRYFDWNGSGTNAKCEKKDSHFATWAQQLRKRGLKGYITESAFGSYKGIPSSCRVVGADAVAAVKANADVIMGVTWWGGGRIWPETYIYKMEPKKAERFTAPVPGYIAVLKGQ